MYVVVMVVFKQPSPLNSAIVFLLSTQFNFSVSSDRGVTFIMKYNTCKMGNVMQHGHFLNMLYLFLITVLTTYSETFWAFQGPTSLLQPPIPQVLGLFPRGTEAKVWHVKILQ
jgi:hypothetical protein